MISVYKRNGSIVPFDIQKVIEAVNKAASRTHPKSKTLAVDVAAAVSRKLPEQEITVEAIHALVENALMDSGEYDTAREYITYRFSHKPSVFRKRTNLKPYEYPDLLEYVDAIRHSYWVHTEFNYQSDVQDYYTALDENQRTIVKRAMLAISHIEVSVKTFWAKIADVLPKPEIAAVGVTFAESEVRHADAYSNLLELLNLNDEFKEIEKVPAIKARIEFLEKAMRKPENKEDMIKNLLVFSTLIENASLFSQFYIMMKFNKEHNILKGISNAVQATSKEEDIHARFGIELINIIKEEHPEIFTEEFERELEALARESIVAEDSIIAWIFDHNEEFAGEMYVCQGLVANRIVDAFNSVGYNCLDDLYDKEVKADYEWFDNETKLSTNIDFFYKKSTAYSKGVQSFTSSDLF
jgi:ribonucleoside-diphosphate reductase beta chain